VAATSRLILSPQRRQANAREAAMNVLRAGPDHPELLLSLRQRWSAVGVGRHTILFTSLRALDRIQRGPTDADLYARCRIRPSDQLRVYLSKLDEITAEHLRLTDAGAPAWWVRQELHHDAIGDDPPDWWDRVDLWRFARPAPAPEVRITTQAFGVRLQLHDPSTGELASTQVFPTITSATAFITETLARHQQSEGWQHNAVSEAKMLERDIPALMQWYRVGRPPPAVKTRRLVEIAGDVLMLDPPRSDATPRKTEPRFFARLGEIVD
jgi:hypothetical protein